MTQQEAVRKAMSNGDWWTLFSLRRCLIARHNVYAAETSLSARVRHLRKPEKCKEGETPKPPPIVEKRLISGHRGLWEYRMVTK